MNTTSFVEMPLRVRALPKDPERGYPVPFFVAWVDGKPDFRIADGRKVARCITEKLCWICGQRLGKHLAFVVGPMCAVNRVSAEPPMHRDCAEYSVAVCPFLLNPKQKRNPREKPEEVRNPGGTMLERNPGVMVLWLTASYRVVDDGNGGYIMRLGAPEEVHWYSQGRQATRAEVLEGLNSGLPILEQMAAEEGPGALEFLHKELAVALTLVPKA